MSPARVSPATEIEIGTATLTAGVDLVKLNCFHCGPGMFLEGHSKGSRAATDSDKWALETRGCLIVLLKAVWLGPEATPGASDFTFPRGLLVDRVS